MPPERKSPPARESAPPAKAAAPSGPTETGWLPDFVYTGEKFETGLAFYADALGRISRFSREPADLARARRLAGQAALPGLVDAHGRALRRALRGRSGANLADQLVGQLTPGDLFEIARLAFVESLLSGVTCVGEFHELQRGLDDAGVPAHEVLRAAHDVGLRLALFPVAAASGGSARTVTATADQFVRETETLRTFAATNYAPDEAWLGVAVRDASAVPADYLKTLATYAHAQRFRFQVPMAGTAGLSAAQSVVDKRCTVIPGAALTDDDIKLLGSARATVCICPGSGRALPAIDKLLAAGVGVAVGSGTRTHGHFLADARAFEPSLRSATAAFHAATVTGARSLGATGGALEVGRPADFFTVNLLDPSLAGSDPTTLLANLLFAGDRRAVHEVWIGARQIVAGGRHPHQGAIVSRFAETQKRLGSAG